MTLAIQHYRQEVATARQLLRHHPAIVELLSTAISPPLLHRFLIEFSARGVQITRPVDGWIRRAGENCVARGNDEVGRQLMLHSKHEAGHHEMLIDDTRALVASWNARYAERLDAEVVLAAPMTAAMQQYIDLHEETIASEWAYGQVAIELEIEGMSVTFGPLLVEQCKRVLGDAVTKGLSFIHEHVELDVGHTALNEAMMQKLLALRPDAATRLAEIGSRALRTYVAFFGECLDISRRAIAASGVITAAAG